MKEKAE